MSREALLSATFVQLADTLVDDFDVVDLLTVVSDRCVEILDVAATGLMLAGPDRELRVMASSSEAMRLLELFEIQTAEGPCLDAFNTGHPVENHDLAAEGQPWPRFAREARAAGFASVSALPMKLRGSVIGALNLFRREPGALADDDIAIAQAFADVATIAILQHRVTTDAQTLNEQLTFALNSRVIIEQAKGVLAERLDVAMPVAFGRLRTHARRNNLRLSELAAAVVAGDVSASDLET